MSAASTLIIIIGSVVGVLAPMVALRLLKKHKMSVSLCANLVMVGMILPAASYALGISRMNGSSGSELVRLAFTHAVVPIVAYVVFTLWMIRVFSSKQKAVDTFALIFAFTFSILLIGASVANVKNEALKKANIVTSQIVETEEVAVSLKNVEHDSEDGMEADGRWIRLEVEDAAFEAGGPRVRITSVYDITTDNNVSPPAVTKKILVDTQYEIFIPESVFAEGKTN